MRGKQGSQDGLPPAKHLLPLLLSASEPACSQLWPPRIVNEIFTYNTAATAESPQSCPTLCDPIPGILQARTLEWVTISFSNA